MNSGNGPKSRQSLIRIGIIALIAVIGFSFTACDNGNSDNGNGGQGVAPSISTLILANGEVGTAYSQILAATGDKPITWNLEDGALPIGLNLLRDGAISGTPTTAGTSTFTVKATNTAGSNTKEFSITITTVEIYPEIYPGPGTDLYRSPLYTVEILNGEEWVDSYTYSASRTSVTLWHYRENPTVSFTTFGTTTETDIRIHNLHGTIISIQISPKAKNIGVQLENDTAQFRLSKLDKVWITINDDDANPLFICADPPKPKIPSGAKYFGPGVHEIGRLFRPKNDQTIYLDGGAWVKGNFDIRGLNNIKIIGPGVLSGEMWRGEILENMAFEKTIEYFMILGDYGAQNTGNYLEGVTIVNTPGYCTFGGLNVMRNVKLLSPWFWSTDGFYIMPDSITRQGLIEDCLAFIGDDVFFPRENVHGDITIRNCLVGTTNNNVFCMSYWPQSLENDYYTRVENIDIKTYNEHAVFQSILDGNVNNAGMGIHNQIYKDIRIEGNILCPLIRIENRPYPWGGDANSPVLGRSRNIQFINIFLEGSQHGKSSILGKDAENGHRDYLFENVRIGGTLVTESNFNNFFTINKFVQGITIR